MRAMPKGVRSSTSTSNRGRPRTKIEEEETVAATEEAATIPVQEPGNKKTHKVFMTVRLADDWIASDQTGAFPRTSSRGNKYISVFYMYDPNFIKGVTIKSKHADELLQAFQKVYKWCEARGIKPELHRMDNETSTEVENFIEGQKTKLQYTTPGRHCAPAEKGVQTYKATFKYVLASLPKEFPITH